MTGHPEIATCSTPATLLRCSATCCQREIAAGPELTTSTLIMRSAENPVGSLESRSNVATKSPATISTTKQNATCTLVTKCINRRLEAGPSPPLSDLAGFTLEARRVGIMPKSTVTTQEMAKPNPSRRESNLSTKRMGLAEELTD